jgi:hypothetical protein
MKNKNTTLNEARKEAFDVALANYDFGDEFVGNAPITKDGNIWSCVVYLGDEEEGGFHCGDSFMVSFMVQFVEETSTVEYMSHDCL